MYVYYHGLNIQYRYSLIYPTLSNSPVSAPGARCNKHRPEERWRQVQWAPGCREVSARSQAARCHLTTLQRLKNSVCLMNHFYEESFHKVFSFRSQNIPGNYFNGPLSMETGIYAIFILQNTSINPRLWLFLIITDYYSVFG